MRQLVIDFGREIDEDSPSPIESVDYIETLRIALSGDLDFSNEEVHPGHKLHSFPAKFPPQLPRLFIDKLTKKGEVVLDPMMGSGTTILEALLSSREAIGFDIDPLALMISRVKTSIFERRNIQKVGSEITKKAKEISKKSSQSFLTFFCERFDKKTKDFLDFWFLDDVKVELASLILSIESLTSGFERDFFYLMFSSVIITKNGGVSLALDLAHTRPHKAKKVISRSGEVILYGDISEMSERKLKVLTKRIYSPIDSFEKRLSQGIDFLIDHCDIKNKPSIAYANSQYLPIPDKSVDLIVTSPPYPSNAIDYMRAHKFSLSWFGFSMNELSSKRSSCIGSDNVKGLDLRPLPNFTFEIVEKVSNLKPSKGKALHRYYSEMFNVLEEMFRTLKPGKAAILVVGNSTISGQDTSVQTCLTEIGQEIGFQIPEIGIRKIDRNKRMLPAGNTVDKSSKIQCRMHEEYVIGFYKPLCT